MYGVHVLSCSCGWLTIYKSALNPPCRCEACGLEGTARFDQEVACVVASLVEIQSRRIQQHAEKSSLRIYQVSKNRWVVLDTDCPNAVNYGDGQARGFMSMKAVCGPADWQTVMKFLRDNTEPLPDYLKSE